MSSFEDRKKSFEKKFAHDEELMFKISARKNKYIGEWVSNILGYDEEKKKEYIQSVIKADFQEVGDQDLLRYHTYLLQLLGISELVLNFLMSLV